MAYQALLSPSLLNYTTAVPSTGLFIPSSLTYLLPQPYFGPQPAIGNLTANWLSTITASDAVNDLFKRAQNATYYAFDEEFYTILGGASPDIEEVASGPRNLYYEGGAWLPDRNEVWMASDMPMSLTVLDLKTHKTVTLDIPELREANPAGLSYHDGLVYAACAGNETAPNGAPAIYTIHPQTLQVTPILNNFFGLRTLIIDDLTIVKPNTKPGATSCTVPGETNIFFTSFSLGSQGFNFTLPETLPNAVWRFSPQTQSLQGAIARADVKSPNGIEIDPSGRYLYVSDTDAPHNKGNAIAGGGAQSSGSSAIYRFDLDEECIPFNKKLIALVRSYADGLHIDNFGRIWTAEYDGIVVRNPRGKVLGVFNAYALLDGTTPAMSNFALAGDKLIIQAVNRLFVLQLGQNVTGVH